MVAIFLFVFITIAQTLFVLVGIWAVLTVLASLTMKTKTKGQQIEIALAFITCFIYLVIAAYYFATV